MPNSARSWLATRGVPAGATTVFESVGMAVEDVAAAKLVYDRLQGG